MASFGIRGKDLESAEWEDGSSTGDESERSEEGSGEDAGVGAR